MTIGLRIALTLVVLVATAPIAMAMGKPDCSGAVPAVQAAVTATCDCATATNHGQFVRCAGQVVKGLVATGAVGKTCKGAMVRVLAKSSCGKTDAVACCFVDKPCRVKKTAICARLGGLVGSTPFCADACVPGSPSGAFID
jgi:hypothetical protein